MSLKLKAITSFMILLLCFIIASYLRNYYEAVDKAEEYIREGKSELVEYELDFAGRSIRGMFIAFIIWTIAMIPIIYGYYKIKTEKK
jgi:hypothetical protein